MPEDHHPKKADLPRKRRGRRDVVVPLAVHYKETLATHPGFYTPWVTQIIEHHGQIALFLPKARQNYSRRCEDSHD